MAPAIVRPSVRRHSIKVELSTPAIGAELSNISLADAAQDPDAIAEIRALWLKHKVLFFRDQDITPMEQQNFAAQFAELEAHPFAPSHPAADKLDAVPQSRPEQAQLRRKDQPRKPLACRCHLQEGAAPRRGVALRTGSGDRRRHHVVQHGDGL